MHQKRRELDLSQTAAFEVLGPRLGFADKSRTAFRAIDLGLREPTEAEARVIAEWLGGYPTDEAAAAPEPLPDLYQTLKAQAEALTTLATSIDNAALAVLKSQEELPERVRQQIEAQAAQQFAVLEKLVTRIVDARLASTSQRP